MFNVQEELSIFLLRHTADLASLITDESWLWKLAYLADMSNLLKQLNLSFQETHADILLGQNK